MSAITLVPVPETPSYPALRACRAARRSSGWSARLLALCLSASAWAQPVEVWRNDAGADWRNSNHLYRNYTESRKARGPINDLSFLRFDTAETPDARSEAWQRDADYRAAVADPRKRLGYVRQHAAKDKGRGHYMAAACYLAGDCGEKADPAKALAAARRGAEAGHARSMTLLAEGLLVGHGVPADAAQALRWFQRAGEAGDPRGWFGLGQSAFRGEGQPQNFAKARAWLMQAGDDPQAWGLLGVLLANGDGGPADPDKAADHFKRAAEAKDLLGMAHYGDYLYYGIAPVERDRAAARPYLRAAAEAGLGSSMWKWARMLREGSHADGGVPQPAAARAMLESAAAQGEGTALFDLGDAQARGELGFSADKAAALPWMLKAAQAPSPSSEAMNWLTLHYHLGGNGAEARRFNDMALREGSARAYFNRGMAELEGFWGLPAEQPTALGWFRKAMENEFLEAHRMLARIYLIGELGQKDGVQGCKHALAASEGGFRDTFLWSAQCLEHGLGGTVDLPRAIGWYRRAAEAGNQAAPKHLARLGIR